MSNVYPPHDPDINPEDQQAARAVKSQPRPALTPASVQKIERQALKRLREQKQRAFRFPQFHSFPRLAVALSIVVALILATSGTVAASAGSLPGEPLYAVKRLGEQTELFFAPADQRAAIHVAHAETRLSEIEKLAARGVILPGLLNELNAETQAAIAGAKTLPAKQQANVLSAIMNLIAKQETALAIIKSQLPSTHVSQPDLSHAQSELGTQQQDVITYAEKLSVPLTVQSTLTATPTKQVATSTATVTVQPTTAQPPLTPTRVETHTPTPLPTSTTRPLPTATSTIAPTQQSAQSTATSSAATSTPPGQSGSSNAGGNPNNNAGGNPNNNAGGNPDNNAGGNPNNNAGGNPDNNAGGNPNNNAGGNPDNNAGGNPDNNAGGGGKKP
ncbi:MAG: hypothetical protein HZC38_05110 [Chloroflexi bacterium]|nr:hypothetical protein [Chloroflexota bacterium]